MRERLFFLAHCCSLKERQARPSLRPPFDKLLCIMERPTHCFLIGEDGEKVVSFSFNKRRCLEISVVGHESRSRPLCFLLAKRFSYAKCPRRPSQRWRRTFKNFFSSFLVLAQKFMRRLSIFNRFRSKLRAKLFVTVFPRFVKAASSDLE